jgi:pimeloyl-ACP methyl ester carboxylesterase
MQPDLPELLVGPQIDAYLRYFLERWTVQRQGLAGGIDHYLDAFRQPGALRAGFDDYRATDQDLIHDRASADAGERLAMPVLALWGEHGLPGDVDVVDVWSEFASDVRGEAIPDCGHFLAEEQPQALVDRLLAFFAEP